MYLVILISISLVTTTSLQHQFAAIWRIAFALGSPPWLVRKFTLNYCSLTKAVFTHTLWSSYRLLQCSWFAWVVRAVQASTPVITWTVQPDWTSTMALPHWLAVVLNVLRFTSLLHMFCGYSLFLVIPVCVMIVSQLSMKEFKGSVHVIVVRAWGRLFER